MVYYTIYMKNLYNGTGYIDIALETDQLLKDYLQFLDIGLRTHKTYAVATASSPDAGPGSFAINLADIAAITVVPPKKS
jgi:hypothetical protein